MALLYDEVKNISKKALYESFLKKNITIYYRHWFGTYRIKRGKARGDLMIFKTSFYNEMCRTGIEPWLFWYNHKRYHRFPSSLLEQPLPKAKFAGIDLSVPRKGYEIQKYFYPNDWWKETKPKGC